MANGNETTNAMQRMADALTDALRNRVDKKRISVCNPDKMTVPQILHWIRQFQEVVAAEDWSDEEVIKAFRESVAGSASQWIMRTLQTDEIVNSIVEILDEFQMEYISRAELQKYKHDLRTRKQQSDESVRVFIKKLAQEWKTIEPNVNMLELIDRITNCLIPELREWVASMEPTSINELIRFAGSREAALCRSHTDSKGKVLYIDDDNDEEEAPRKRRYNMKCDTDDEYDNDVPTRSHTKVVKRHKNEEDIPLGVKAMLADIRQKVEQLERANTNNNNDNHQTLTTYSEPPPSSDLQVWSRLEGLLQAVQILQRGEGAQHVRMSGMGKASPRRAE
ncbi:hypothetical protein Pelo_18911 [Pelomyxa schiedti]|nr:hypothetical protein Pelo_18911 [Pelomyxa schiedti]